MERSPLSISPGNRDQPSYYDAVRTADWGDGEMKTRKKQNRCTHPSLQCCLPFLLVLHRSISVHPVTEKLLNGAVLGVQKEAQLTENCPRAVAVPDETPNMNTVVYHPHLRSWKARGGSVVKAPPPQCGGISFGSFSQKSGTPARAHLLIPSYPVTGG